MPGTAPFEELATEQLLAEIGAGVLTPVCSSRHLGRSKRVVWQVYDIAGRSDRSSHPVAPGRLRGVHGRVGPSDERIAPIVAAHRRADAHADGSANVPRVTDR